MTKRFTKKKKAAPVATADLAKKKMHDTAAARAKRALRKRRRAKSHQ